MRAVFLHHPNRQNHERTTGACYAFNIRKWDPCKVLHSYSLTATSKLQETLSFQFRITRPERCFQARAFSPIGCGRGNPLRPPATRMPLFDVVPRSDYILDVQSRSA